MEKVGLLHLKTGVGHYSAARALAQQMSANDVHGAEPELIDPISENQVLKTVLEELIRSNGFDPLKKRILIMSGGEGGGKRSIALLRYLLDHRENYEILFICGKSEKVYSKALKMVKAEGGALSSSSVLDSMLYGGMTVSILVTVFYCTGNFQDRFHSAFAGENAEVGGQRGIGLKA